ncbi:MAG: phosphotransferase [Bacteroidales bacterium]|nr:phosphotransferase [Bacteroidales bacterium]MCF8344491.1 phosphotransferase [Bacteroidales bacterium]MCF8350994.1 phosphotransferase [Bacteroidales bacterium]MCF8376118.1 phosphotransferase [Bacteroidales bacterium]MCF8401431.1 phosphotransferase [Bacteroidales bacterium]
MKPERIKEIVGRFRTGHGFYSFKELKTGHINKTYLINPDSDSKFILQKINQEVFRDPLKLAFNLLRLDGIFGSKTVQYPYVFPKIHYPRNHMPLLREGDKYWRLMDYVKNTTSYSIPPNAEMAFEGAKAFGAFQKPLLEEPAISFYTPIMNFRNLNMRMRSLKSAIKRDSRKRKKTANAEINKIIEREDINAENHKLIKSGKLKKVICHNDTKPDNILLEAGSNHAKAVIDFDTVQAGYLIYDFGDMVRSFCNPVKEDSTDSDKINVDKAKFEAIAEGYFEEVGDQIQPSDKSNLSLGIKTIIFMQAVRFLTDYLNGDIYYKTTHPGHNLDRCRNQLQLLDNYIQQEANLEKNLRRILN